MSIIKQYHKDTDTTYVYESKSFWDPEKKQSRSKRTVIGKIDPETGEIIPTRKKGRAKSTESIDTQSDEVKRITELYESAKNEIISLKSELRDTKTRLVEIERRNRKLEEALKKVVTITSEL